MMIHAYQEIYLSKAQIMMGTLFDTAVNQFEIDGDSFIKMFLVSDVRKKIENGEPEYIAGKSGKEVLLEILSEVFNRKIDLSDKIYISDSLDYWIGWAVCYYQWYSNRKFSDIFMIYSYEDLKFMYNTFHQADISKFVEAVDKRINEYFKDTNLKRIRTLHGYTQKELSVKSGVSLRSIQMYEQCNKDINKASLETIYAISKALGCQMEDLVER